MPLLPIAEAFTYLQGVDHYYDEHGEMNREVDLSISGTFDIQDVKQILEAIHRKDNEVEVTLKPHDETHAAKFHEENGYGEDEIDTVVKKPAADKHRHRGFLHGLFFDE